MAADHHLLFGLLALQNGLIDQGQLVAAFQAWTRDRSRGLADHLIARGDLDTDQRTVVEAMAALHVKKHGGDTEKSLAAIPAGPSTRARLDALDDPELTGAVAQLGAGSSEPEADRTVSYAVGSATSEGQRFRILRPHARGGLGEVFIALDAELNREVALKQILDHHADDPTCRTRFVIEAEITGGLEHPGIVPVYGLGHHADGRPYYAMRFIRGDTLKDAIAGFHGDRSKKADPSKRSLALRNLLRRFVDVCNAIDYAHGRGVIHRDLKPGNVVVGRHGETLVVDWGLAKPIGRAEKGSPPDERTLMPSSSSGSANTVPGSAIGTPAYMSPEQARGDLDRLGPHSDVYSLGATLYCLLTSKPPFEGDDVGAVLQAVGNGEFPPPRSIEPTIERPLEAICKKAMATRPEDRYPSARALAEDVERWMADEPVLARREPAWSRARRWMRRHRVAVAAASAALVMATLGLAGGLAREAQSRQRLAAINLRLRETNARLVAANARESRAKEQERARFDLARNAVEAYYKGASEDVLLKQPEFTDLRKKLLRTALDFYRELTSVLEAGQEEDPEVRVALAAAYDDLGEITSGIGSNTDALSIYQHAADLYDRLCRSRPGDAELSWRLSSALQSLAKLHGVVGQIPEALRVQERARVILAELSAAHPRDPRFQRELAASLGNSGKWIGVLGRTAEGLESLQRAAAILDELVAADPDDLKSLEYLAQCHDARARLHGRLSRQRFAGLFEAIRESQSALAIREKLAAARPNDPEYQEALVKSLNSVADSLVRTDRISEALALFLRARDLWKKLSSAHPTITRYQGGWVVAQAQIAYLLLPVGRPNEALVAAREVLPAAEELVAANPDVSSYRSTLASLHWVIGMADLDLGQLPESIAAFREGSSLLRQLFRQDPANGVNRSSLDQCLDSLAQARHRQGQSAEAAGATLERRALWPGDPQKLVNIAGQMAVIARGVGRAKAEGDLSAAEHTERLRYADTAMETLRQAIAAGFDNPRDLARDTSFDPLRTREDFSALFGGDANFPPMPFVGGHYVEPDALEGEALQVESSIAGEARPQTMDFFGDGWSAGGQLWWRSAKAGDELRIRLPVEAGGMFDVSVGLTRSFDYGVTTLSLDGRPLGGPLDLYGANVGPSGTIRLGRVVLGPGPHLLTVRIDDKNAKSTGYFFGLDWIKLKPVR